MHLDNIDEPFFSQFNNRYAYYRVKVKHYACCRKLVDT